VCVIGEKVRRDLFGFEPALGRPLKVNDQWLTVVGVLEGGGGKREIQGVTLEGTDNDIYLPVTAAERRFGRAPLKAPLDELVVSMAPGSPVQESAAVVSTLLDRLHGGAADYTITVPEALLQQSQKTQRLFDIVMGAIAGISLLVGGIGIMNIMLATVLERTREIGVRRAMGARQIDIRNQFVMEAFAVTVTGGLLGIAMGLAIAKGVAAYAGWKTIVTLWSIALSVGVSAGVGLVFGIYPASIRWKRSGTSSPRQEVVRGEAEVLRAGRRQAARPLAQQPLVLAERVDEQLATAGGLEREPGHALVAAAHDVVDVVDDARVVGEGRADEGELVDGRAGPAHRIGLVAQRNERRFLPFGADHEVVAPRRDGVGHVHGVPDERLRYEEALGDAVRVVDQPALARADPEGDAVLLEREETRAGERDVQLLPRVRREEREVEVEPARDLRREVALELGEVTVAGAVLELDRAVAAHVEGVRETRVAATALAVPRALPDRERVGARGDRRRPWRGARPRRPRARSRSSGA
jgi:hypothetical protein